MQADGVPVGMLSGGGSGGGALKCELPENQGLPWTVAKAAADAAGVRLPTCAQLAAAGVAREADVAGRDIWMPVRRADGMVGDWCGLNKNGLGSCLSHVGGGWGVPGWGAETKVHGCKPGSHPSTLHYFYVAKDDAEVDPAKMVRRFVACHRRNGSGALHGASEELGGAVEKALLAKVE